MKAVWKQFFIFSTLKRMSSFMPVYHKSKYLSLLSGNKTKTNSLQRIEAKVVSSWKMKFRLGRWDMWVHSRPPILIYISALTKASNKSTLILASSQPLENKFFISYFCNFVCRFCALKSQCQLLFYPLPMFVPTTSAAISGQNIFWKKLGQVHEISESIFKWS